MDEAIAIGKLLAGRMIATMVHRGNVCESACALAFLGGRSFWPTGGIGTFVSRYIEPGARPGFHSPSFDRDALTAFAAQGKFDAPVESTRVSLKTLAAYLEDMGVGSPSVVDVMDTPISSMHYVNSANELFSFNINSSPMDLSGLAVGTAIRAACEKMVAATSRTRPVTSGYIDSKLEMFSIGQEDFLGFGLEDIVYIRFACGVHLSEEESTAYRGQAPGHPDNPASDRAQDRRTVQAGPHRA